LRHRGIIDIWRRYQLYSLVRGIATTRATDFRASSAALNLAKQRLFELLSRWAVDTVAAKAITLKLLNLCLARRHFLVRDAELLSLPPGLVVDTSNACNLACPGCVHSARARELRLFDWKPGLLSGDCLAAFLRRYGAAAIYATLCNYGEPLANPETPKFIQMAKRYLLHTTLSTNMTVPRFDAVAYADSGLDYMVVSADGATQAVYERFRRKGDLQQVFENVRALVAARGSRRTPVLAWRFLAFEHNVHEIPEALERARALGFDEFRAETAWDIGWDDPTIRPAIISAIKTELRPRGLDALAKNWNPFPMELDEDAIEREFEREWRMSPGPNPANSPAPSCEWLYKSLTMDAGGRIFPCCCAPTPRKDLHFASFDATGSDSSFNSEKHRMARASFADPAVYRADRDSGSPGVNPYCTRCEWDKVADPSPEHIRQYFRAAAPQLFDRRTLDCLAW
jgi:MoaA/NifB/PqqE/SkfB family radical SAM enzyme